MILGWIRRDGMARILMTGVILTPLSGAAFTRCLLVNYYWMSDISTQLLLDEYDNEQPLERLLNSIYYIANLLFNTNLTILATILIIISNVIQGSRQNACREGVGNKQNSNYTHSIAARPKAGPINVA